MNHYVVLYHGSGRLPADPPLAFTCEADDAEHAEEQCRDADIDADIVWVYEGDNVQAAYSEYWDEV